MFPVLLCLLYDGGPLDLGGGGGAGRAGRGGMLGHVKGGYVMGPGANGSAI